MLNVSLTQRFGAFILDIAFDAPPGITAIYGPSGSGKSTIVKSLAGLLRPEKGRIALEDQVLFDRASDIFLPPAQRKIGVVFQEGRLFPHMSVRQNLLYGQKEPPADAAFALEKIVELLGITHLQDRRPGTLSGGEAQRVAIGRALLSAPDLLLMDEPLASLDDRRKAEILPYLEKLRDTLHLPIVYISHSLSEVVRLSTTLILLSEGQIVRAGPTSELMSDPTLVPYLGSDQAGSYLTAVVGPTSQETGLTELQTAGGLIFLPDIHLHEGDLQRLRMPMRDVLVLRDQVPGIGSDCVLEAVLEDVTKAPFGQHICVLRIGGDRILAALSSHALGKLDVACGELCYVVMKPILAGATDI